MNEQKAAQIYAHSNVQTAGLLKSYQLLLDKAILLAKHPEFHLDPVRSRMQNILVQIQISLNLDQELAQTIHKGLAHLWDAMESGNPELREGIESTLHKLRETIIQIDRNLD